MGIIPINVVYTTPATYELANAALATLASEANRREVHDAALRGEPQCWAGMISNLTHPSCWQGGERRLFTVLLKCLKNAASLGC